MSTPRTALITSGIVFALLAISHVVRWLSPVEILIDGKVLPLIFSIFSGIILILLSIWMFFVAKKVKITSKDDKEKDA